MDSFSPEVIKQLQYYVYRLIDPRNGQTFYVGKGKGNRVFAHAKDELKLSTNEGSDSEDEVSAKLKQIREIRQAGLEVIYIIHRFGLTEDEAFEVEAALIDAYGNLTNIQDGHDADRGVNNAEVIEHNLSCKEYEEPGFKYIIIKINDRVLEERNGDLYETVRRAWKVKLEKVKDYKYCLAVLNGVVKEVYIMDRWQLDSQGREGRCEFFGVEAPDDIRAMFVNKRIPECYRKKGMASPVLYHN